MNGHSVCTLTVTAWALLLAGCGGGSYELTLTPEGDSLHRELVYTGPAKPADAAPEDEELSSEPEQTQERAEGQETPPEVNRLADVYEADIPSEEDGRHRFEGIFTGAMPDDVGGAGLFARKETSLGALCIYSERFRGSYEQAITLERRFEKIETFTSLLARWSRVAGKESPLRDRLDKIIADDLRRDLKNAVMLAMTLTATHSESSDEEAMMHVAQFFYERGYIDLNMLLNGQWAGDSDAMMLSQLRQGLVLKLRLDSEQPLLQTWPALADVGKAKASLNEAVEATEVYQQYARELGDKEGENGSPEGTDLLQSLLWEISGLRLESSDSLTVHLKCPHKPLLTNGEWLPDENRVRWQASLATRGSSTADFLPNLCYAIWSEPNREFQQRHFGRVLLEGEALATYCSWRVSLTSQEGDQWDRFLEDLADDDGGPGVISDFRFSEDAEMQSPAAQRVGEIQDLIKDAF